MKHTMCINLFNLNLRLFFFLLSVFVVINSDGQNVPAVNSLDTNSRIKRKINTGETHHYSIQLKAGEFFHAKINQYDIDVVIKVVAVNGQPEQVFDMPTGELDAEDVYLLSNADTKYAIEIFTSQKYPDPGEYDIKIVRLARATEKDKKWMAALFATQKADRLRRPETRSQSILQYETALALWKDLKDDLQYARAMRSLAFVNAREKNYEKAIHLFTRLIPRWKKAGETRSEGYSYLAMGWINNIQKDYKQSLENNLKTLNHWIKTNDVDQEAFTLMNIGTLYGKLNEKEKIIEYYEQALKKSEQSKRPSVKALILREYATAILSKDEADKAVALYKQSLKQWLRTANRPEEANTAVLLASHYVNTGENEQAKQYYQQALDIWKKLEMQAEIKKVEEALGKL